MDVFKIKYLFELFPGVDFEDEFVSLQNVVYNGVEYETVATPEKWALTYDNVKQNRNIQTKKKEKYTVKMILARNIDINEAAVGYTTLTTTDGETFTIRDVEITKEKNEQTLNYTVTLVFWRYTDEIINHLSSDNALAFKTGLSTTVNELTFNVIKPTFTVYAEIKASVISIGRYQFNVPINSMLNKLTVGDDLYVHVLNTSFDNQTYYVAGVHSKDATEIVFIIGGTGVIADFGYANIILNQEADELPTSATVESNSITISETIYTFVNPVLSEVEIQENGINTADGITENQKLNYKGKAKSKFWLTADELYKRRFLQTALAQDTAFTLSDGTTIYAPVQISGISKPIENDKLIDLYEFDLDILYSNLTINYFR